VLIKNILAAAATYESVLTSDINQVQALSESQAPPHNCEQIQLDMDLSRNAACNSMSLRHDAGLATASDPRVSASGTVVDNITGTQKTYPRVKYISASKFRHERFKALNAAGNINFVVPLVVTPAVLSALSVESNNTQDLAA
jgi:hypothetical protein